VTPPGAAAWSTAERSRDLARAARDGVDLLVIGGGITGAGVLRDAAARGLRALLVEREDFASGTSSRSSKLIHGGLRYIAEGQLGMTRESCRERDRMIRLDPDLVRPLEFLLPAYEGGKHPLWQVRAALTIYAGLANFRRTARFGMLSPAEVGQRAPDLRADGLRGAGLYCDGQVDDVRLVLELLKSARELGGIAANHAEVVEFLRHDGGRLCGARVRDALSGETHALAASVIVNAAGPAVERVRGLDRPVERPELRPAKGIHLVIPRDRVRVDVAVSFETGDGRLAFLVPWDDVAMIGTTDTWSDEIDRPTVTIDEVHYLLDAANRAFPRACLTTNDLRSVFAGVRPLAGGSDETKPSTSVSREHRIYADPSGLLSVVGGKLTTYRAMGETIVDRVVAALPAEKRAAVGPSRTAQLPLRPGLADWRAFESELHARFGIPPKQAAHLVRSYGARAAELLESARPDECRPIGASRNTFAEIAWSFRTECPATLCDLLERRLGMAIFAVGQGLRELPEIAAVAAREAGWDAARSHDEMIAYANRVRRSYQIVASPLQARPGVAVPSRSVA
jgi:glycerol-3-phosphate dehydrogenase